MKKPMPIILQQDKQYAELRIEYIGGSRPYIWIGGDELRTPCGYVADRDVKRLHAWTGRCLAKMKRKAKGRKGQ